MQETLNSIFSSLGSRMAACIRPRCSSLPFRPPSERTHFLQMRMDWSENMKRICYHSRKEYLEGDRLANSHSCIYDPARTHQHYGKGPSRLDRSWCSLASTVDPKGFVVRRMSIMRNVRRHRQLERQIEMKNSPSSRCPAPERLVEDHLPREP